MYGLYLRVDDCALWCCLFISVCFSPSPTILSITEVSSITGYTPNAVDRWIVKGSLRSVIVHTGLITCREWLIDFYCGDGYNIVKKVDKHRKLLERIIKL